MKKRLLSILLALCMVLTLFPGAALADSEEGTIITNSGAKLSYYTWYSYTESSVIMGINGCNNYIDGNYITTVEVPEKINGYTVTEINTHTFLNCANLNSVILPAAINFAGYGNNLSDDPGGLGACPDLQNITVKSGGAYFSEDGILYCYAYCDEYGNQFDGEKCLVCYPAGRTDSTFVVPNGVVMIQNAFSNCLNITSVILPDSLISIGGGAFLNCTKLSSITIPASVNAIGYSAFYNCSSLSSITIPDKITSIKSWTFKDCSSLTGVTIPDSITTIGTQAFSGCNSLTDVYYSGTEEQWEEIAIDNGNEPLTSATIHYRESPPPTPPSDEITFRSDDDFNVIVGSSTVILASIPKTSELRQSDITWSSSDESVAIIESSAALIGDSLASATAKIKGVSTGTVTITVSLADGRSARCNVEVVIGPLTDTDGDGLYDIWEINGVDTDGDGVIDLHLEQMGADPNIPDIFVELDWMVQPAEYSGFIQTQEEVSLAPSADAMWLVYQSFKDHGINLHIDAGPDSIDFVTGERWGTLSGGTTIPYEEDFDTDKLWNKYIDAYFTSNRKAVFRHAMFVNTYNGGTSSGVAKLAGQYLIVANQKGLRDTGNIGVAGSFMHELGHTLSLHHGGFAFDPERIPDAELNGKPNYLSVMNYLFQIPGLIGTGGVNYSEYTLPDLTESRLLEADGIDPHGITSGTGLGTKLVGSGAEIVPIAGVGIDFNNDGTIQSRETVVVADLNNNGTTTDTLTGTNDWERIVYKAGTIGQLHSAGATIPEDKQSESINELTIEEALENGVLGRVGSGALEAIGPYTVPAGEYNQKIYIRVKNLSPETVTFTLHMDSSPISSEYDGEVTLEPSIVSISYVDIPLAILGTQSDGNYVIHATLSYSGEEAASINVPVTLHTLTSEDLDVLHDFIEKGTENLPDIVMNEYSDIFNEIRDNCYEITFDATGGTVTPAIMTTNEEGKLIELPTPVRDGYTFDGWFTALDGGEKIATDTVFTEDTTVYAHWTQNITPPEPKGFTVTFNANNGTVTPVTMVTDEKGKLSELPTPVRNGYTFDGWFTALNGGEKITTDTVFTEDTTLYAHWVQVITPPEPKGYTITFDPNGGTVVPMTKTTDEEGKLAELPTPTRNGYSFNGWFTALIGGDQVTVNTVFTSDATVCARWTYNSDIFDENNWYPPANSTTPTTYRIIVSVVSGGTVNVSPTSAKRGDTVTITVTPDSGYELDYIIVANRNGHNVPLTDRGNGKYVFTMPDNIVTLDYAFKLIETASPNQPAVSFIDVVSGAYYYDAVAWAVAQGITNGTTATTFSPDIPCTRGQIVTFLWRAAGSPYVSGSNPFTDVQSGDYWYDAVLWAVSKGITTGTSTTMFSPNDTCTRGQTVTFLYRNAGSPAVTTSGIFTDVAPGAYYSDAVAWALAKNITNGTTATTFSPDDKCIRGQIVTFLYRSLGK